MTLFRGMPCSVQQNASYIFLCSDGYFEVMVKVLLISSEILGEKFGNRQYNHHVHITDILSGLEMSKYDSRGHWESHVDKFLDGFLKKCACAIF